MSKSNGMWAGAYKLSPMPIQDLETLLRNERIAALNQRRTTPEAPQEVKDRLSTVFAPLTDIEREVLMMCVGEGVTHRRAAEMLNRKRSTISGTLQRALRVCREGRKPRDEYSFRSPASCGTVTGYQAHYRKGEKACDSCRLAENKRQREKRARRKARASHT